MPDEPKLEEPIWEDIREILLRVASLASIFAVRKAEIAARTRRRAMG
jgi:hypothetical protein